MENNVKMPIILRKKSFRFEKIRAKSKIYDQKSKAYTIRKSKRGR